MALIHELRNGHFASAGSSDAGNNSNNNNNNGGGGSGSGSGSGNNPTDIFLLSMSRQNFQAVLNAVFKMEQYWAGVTGVSQLLEKRMSLFRIHIITLRLSSSKHHLTSLLAKKKGTDEQDQEFPAHSLVN